MDMETAIIQRLTFVDDKVDLDESNLTNIQEFYKDAKIFITGCTGFLGQIIIDKLLRSCPVSTIYLLIREKKGKGMEARLTEMLDDPLFNRMKKCCPNYRQKIVAIEGDCVSPGLGLSEQDRKILIDEVNIVFHIAATVRFDEGLKKASHINVRATRDISLMVQQMSQFKSFVHVSTAFCNCIWGEIEEKIYPTPIGYNRFLEAMDLLDEQLIETLTPYFLGKNPNTYIYTKQFAEKVVQEETRGLPAAIYRPSIVVSTYKEPIAGWINNIYGATGVMFGVGIGLLRVLYNNSEFDSNIIPVDMCVNGMIATAWDAAKRFEKAKEENEEFEIPVYNYESTNDTNLKWREFARLSGYYGEFLPSTKCLWVYMSVAIRYYYLYVFMAFLGHTVPAAIVDTVLFCRGKKPMLLKAYQKVHYFQRMMRYFSQNSFIFRSFNVRRMIDGMTKKDREVFFCDLKELSWDEFFMTYVPGARVYLAKDPVETAEEGKRYYRKMEWANRAVTALLVLLATALVWYILSTTYRICFT